VGEPNRRRGVTLVEVLVVIVIVAMALTLIVPAIESARESQRRAGCIHNLKEIGLALHNYYDSFKHFPASCEYKTVPGSSTPVNGWSFLVHLTPYIECRPTYDTLNKGDGVKLSFPDDTDPKHRPNTASVGNMVYATFICPSFHGSKFSDPTTSEGALTNYKAIGATHAGSLNRAWDPKAKTLYLPDGGTHPDGGLPPGKGLVMLDFADGLSNTAIVAETSEERFARWIRGDECVLVGFPERSGNEATSFTIPEGVKYYAPAGFQPGRDFGSTGVTVRSYIAWDYGDSKLGHDGTYWATVGPIPQLPATGETVRGVSSDHPGVVNHLFADGAIRSVSNEVDIALYFFNITRTGDDPGCEFFGH
jgi:prepilin-type N-terminal cleavage/methylation domain-containing protein